MSVRPGSVRLFDCSFDLADPDAGGRLFRASRLPGAAYLHLDLDLSAAKNGRNGRHPLPDRAAFARRMAALGARDDQLLVAYDRNGGMYAARAWWMWRWAGHRAAAVLDGGLAAWQGAGLPLQSGEPPPSAPVAGDFSLREPLEATVEYPALRASLGRGMQRVVDARAADRFRGENETLDPVGGHIPGACHRFFRDNLGADGRMKPAAQLRDEWAPLLAGRAPADLVMQCGSGVTACVNTLDLHVAGIVGTRLYAGSWSEWCAQPDAPVATGA